MQEHLLETHVVIVGSGAAGLRCAIELWEQGQKNILVVGDRKFDDAHTTQARGGINAALHTMDPDDKPLIHAVDTYREGQHVAHPDLVEKLANDAPEAIEDLVSWGANFHTEEDGKLTQRFFGAHTYRRTCFSGDETGLEMIKTLTRKANELQIPFIEQLYVYDLATENNKVIGIRAIQGDMHYFIKATHVVFATGGFSNVYRRSSSRNKENFGDGIGMALRAGATIGDIELVQFHPTGLLYPEEKFGELVTEAVRGEGGILTNAKGERFMSTYDPEKMELSTRDVVARANFQEIHEGRGTPNGGVWLDISHRGKEYILDRLPKMYAMILERNNVDISQAPVEVAPTTHYTMGGIWFDAATMETGIAGFRVAGECTMGVHGANRLGGNSLMETMVYGKEVAKKIMGSTIQSSDTKNNEKPTLLQRLKEGGVDPVELITEIRKQTRELAGIVRTENELQQLATYLEKVEQKISKQGVQQQEDSQTSITAVNRLYSVLELGKLICKGALERKESRGAHFRSDYPETDDQYRKNYLHKLDGEKITSFWQDLPAPSSSLQEGLDNFEKTKNYQHLE